MAAPKEKEKEIKTPTIEELGKNIDPALFAGVCAQEGWRPGKKVSREQFEKAVSGFQKAPMGGRRTEK